MLLFQMLANWASQTGYLTTAMEDDGGIENSRRYFLIPDWTKLLDG
jgi:hypothetical protein